MDADKIKNFFIYHVEKMILVVVLLATVFMIKSGSGKPDILQDHQPSRLVDDANQVKAGVDEDHNDMVLKDRDPLFDIGAEIVKKNNPVPTKGYNLGTWKPEDTKVGVKRQDPRLIAPRAVQVHGVLTSIALRSDETPNYVLSTMEGAEAPEMEKQEVKRERKPSRRQRAMMMMGEEGMDDMMAEEEEMMEEMMDMGMDMSMGTSMAGPIRKYNPNGDFGTRPMSTKNVITDTAQEPTLGVGYFIAGTAVAPWKELYESYAAALEGAEDYDPVRRDRPMFTSYMVQRADVTEKSVDQLVDADWIVRDDRVDVIKDAAVYWAGVAPELVSKEYRADTTLTMWIPPVLLDDYSTFTLHPLIPLKTPAQLEAEAAQLALDNREKTVDLSQITLKDENGPTRMMQSFDEDMMDQYGDSGFGFGQATFEKDPVDYKLIRFYDFAIDPAGDKDAPKPGRKYVYRVKVSLQDPNFVQERQYQPKGSMLAASVYQRVAKAELEPEPSYARWTEWSEPSEPVSLPGLNEFNTGPITASTKTYEIGGRTVEYETKQSAKMVVSQFNNELRTRVPMMLKSVGEGTVLSVKSETADVVDPITLEIKKYENPEVMTAATVIDIDGGGELEIQDGDGMTVPGMMLLFDSEGGLRVHDEAGDQEFYRIRSFAEERGEK